MSFIQAKAVELAEYMVAQGYGYDVTGSVLLGIGAGWVAVTCGATVANESLERAKRSYLELLEPESKSKH